MTSEPSTRKKGAAPAKRRCIWILPSGKVCRRLFNSKDPSDRYCPRCRNLKKLKQQYTYEDDMTVGIPGV